MHIAIVGAGALGAIYGAHAEHGGAKVSFVVRSHRLDTQRGIVTERVHCTRIRQARRGPEIPSPTFVAEVPSDADLVIVAVGTTSLPAMIPLLDPTSVPIVVLTPMMPQEYRRLGEALGARVLAAMPSVVSYEREDGVFRYWIVPSPTCIDEPRAGDRTAPRELATILSTAGLPTTFELGVHEKNPATTVSAIPLFMTMAVAGGLDALRRDDELVSLAASACREGVALGHRIGAPMPGSGLMSLAAHQVSLRAFEAICRAACPEFLHYLDAHFARKLVPQHLRMARSMVDLARSFDLSHAALSELERRLSLALSQKESSSPRLPA